MNIQELEDKHGNIPLEPLNFDEFYEVEHTKLSVEFAISVLEEFTIQYCECGRVDANVEIESKIQELKQYLNEEC